MRAERALEVAMQKTRQSERDEALDRNLGFDESFLKHLCSLVDMFYPDRYDVTILPQHSTGKVAFRGVLDKK